MLHAALNIPLITLGAVFLLIAIRQVGRFRFQIWQAMAFGSIVVLVTGQISVSSALSSINPDIMLFLFAMFVVGQSLQESGYLSHLTYKYSKRARNINSLMLIILFGAGGLSALLMNDTLAIIGTPVVLLLARKHEISPKLLLLSLAFAITLGSVMSPIGNPQNLLIALSGEVDNPFVTFARHLFLPTLLNLYLTFLIIRRFFHEEFHEAVLIHSQEPIRDHDLAVLSRIALWIIVLLVSAKTLLSVLSLGQALSLTHIAAAACLPVLIGSRKRWGVLRRIDWHTLIFFAAMFILMESVWRTGFFQAMIERTDIRITSITTILGVSVIVSQFVSNVPLVALYQPILLSSGTSVTGLMALAAGSTIAGNLFILGAASNVIIIQNAEKRSHCTLTFLEFAKVGIPVTATNLAVYWFFLAFL